VAKELVIARPLQESLAFKFSKENTLLNSYYQMRAEAFAKVWNLKHKNAEEDELDRKSDILMVMDGKNCVAGARLSISSPDNPTHLSFEVDNFRVADFFPDLKCYGEISRFAIMDGYRETEICKEMLRIMAEKGKSYSCECFVVVSPQQTARFFKRIYNSLGYETTIHKNIAVPARPTYEGIRMYVMTIELKNKG
jgi:Acetyltransferase (GNAT) domain